MFHKFGGRIVFEMEQKKVVEEMLRVSKGGESGAETEEKVCFEWDLDCSSRRWRRS